MKKSKIYILSLISVLLWGLSYRWSDELISQNIPVEYFVFLRVLIAGSLLLFFNLINGSDIKIHKKDLRKFILLGFCEPFVYFTCETYGIFLTGSPTYSAMIISTTPFFSIIAGTLIFKEKLTLSNIIGFAVCLAGMTMMTISKSDIKPTFVIGAILLIVAVLAEVGHATCTKFLSGTYKPMVITMYQFLIGGFFMMPVFFLKGLNDFVPQQYLSWSVWKPILCLALLCSSLAFTLWVRCIKELGVAKSGVLTAMIPTVTAVSGVILKVEPLTLLQWVGIAVALSGLLLSQGNGFRRINKSAVRK